MNSTLHKVERYINVHIPIKKGAKVVVGISGGPDSVCLAVMMQKLGYDIIGIHCNFHLRGEESMRDETFVKKLCEERGISLYKVDFDTLEFASKKKISVEMAARELRYEKFRALKEKMNADAIAVGHHRDDNNETFILNAVRGTGIKGLCAIQPVNGDIIRPLLCLSRADILDYLASEHQLFVTDHTNMEDEYSRNKVRLDVMPLLKLINEGAAANINTTIENLNEVMKVYNAAISLSVEQCCATLENGEIRINKISLLSQPSPLSVLHEVLSPLGFNRDQIRGILDATHSTGRFFESANKRLLVDRKEIIVEGEYKEYEIRQNLVDAKELVIKKDTNHAYLDADKLKGELSFRHPKDGDSFAPFGMKGKRKLLSDFLTDQKLSRFEKERQLLACDGDEIVWVVGRRSSELYRVDGKTKKVLVLTCDVHADVDD